MRDRRFPDRHHWASSNANIYRCSRDYALCDVRVGSSRVRAILVFNQPSRPSQLAIPLLITGDGHDHCCGKYSRSWTMHAVELTFEIFMRQQKVDTMLGTSHFGEQVHYLICFLRLPVRQRIEFKLVVLVNKTLNGLPPQHDCQLTTTNGQRRLRSSNVATCEVLRTRTCTQVWTIDRLLLLDWARLSKV